MINNRFETKIEKNTNTDAETEAVYSEFMFSSVQQL